MSGQTISERLRNDVCLTSTLDWQEHVALAREAADLIDALVKALRPFAELDPPERNGFTPYTREEVLAARAAARAAARKET